VDGIALRMPEQGVRALKRRVKRVQQSSMAAVAKALKHVGMKLVPLGYSISMALRVDCVRILELMFRSHHGSSAE
jgi:hypothetical protein